MPYVNRSNRNTYRRPRTTRRVLRRKPTIYKRQPSIATLTKKVNQLSYKQQQKQLPLLFKKNDDFNLSSNFVDKLMVAPTGIPGHTAWTQVFGANANASESRQLTIKSMHMKYDLTAGDEESLINHTITMITPKSRKVLRETFNENTGQLNLVSDQDYIIENGMALVNKTRWNVRYYKRHHTVQIAPAGSDITMPIKDNIGSINLNNLNWSIKNTQGSWQDVTTHELPYYMRCFLVCFNNNSNFDLEYPTFAHTTLYKCLATGAK